jgi:xanthine dehydrogenase accessory factor
MKTWALILRALEGHGRCALVSVVKTEGSAPRDAGARLVVTPEGFHGTIGGGTLEWRAIAEAQSLLDRGAAVKLASHALGPDMGQCCGGRVQLATEIFDTSSLSSVRDLTAREAQSRFTLRGRIASLDIVESFGEDNRRLYLFGAGHVGKALVLALAPLPFDVHWIDARPGAFPRAVPQNVTLAASADLAEAPDGSLVYVMTHSHALDLAITDQALRNPRIAHVGLIGSATKRARFVKRLREAHVEEARIEGLICPIGVSGIRSKEPAMIATATAAQLLALDEALRAGLAADQAQVAEKRRGAL